MAQLFVGVWPSKKIVANLADYPMPEDVGGWSTPAQWLANVRPLGHVADAVVPELLETLRFELDGMPRPTARLATPRAGSWLRVPIEGLDELRDVVYEVTAVIVPITHPRSLPWEVAIPLRRDRSPKELVHPISGSWKVGEVVLAAGRRTKQGHGYETVASIRLG